MALLGRFRDGNNGNEVALLACNIYIYTKWTDSYHWNERCNDFVFVAYRYYTLPIIPFPKKYLTWMEYGV